MGADAEEVEIVDYHLGGLSFATANTLRGNAWSIDHDRT